MTFNKYSDFYNKNHNPKLEYFHHSNGSLCGLGCVFKVQAVFKSFPGFFFCMADLHLYCTFIEVHRKPG